MVIKEEKPVTLAKVQSVIGDSEKSEEIKAFLSNFKILDLKKAEEFKAALEALDLIKLKESHIVKIVDFMPKDAVELNKILSDVSLDEAEIAKIVEISSKY